MLFELLMAVFMEKHTPKSSANSSLPASQSPNDATARSSPRRQGQGALVQRCALRQHPSPAIHVRVLAVDSCARCGEDLTDTACTGHLAAHPRRHRQFEKVVTPRPTAEIKHCTRWSSSRDPCALRPPGCQRPLQYGPGVKAYVVANLLIAQMHLTEARQPSQNELTFRSSDSSCPKRPAARATSHSSTVHSPSGSANAIERLLASPAMHVDET